MKIDNFKLPFRLIHPDFKTVEIVDDIDYLKCQTQLGVKEQALLGCILDDDHVNYYIIVEIIDFGKKGPWWKFEFFNPMKKVELKLSLVEDKLILDKIKSLET